MVACCLITCVLLPALNIFSITKSSRQLASFPSCSSGRAPFSPPPRTLPPREMGRRMQPIQSPRHKLCMNPKHWPSPNNNSPPSRSGSVINLIVQLEGDGARLLLKQSAFHRVHPPAPSVPVMDLSLDPGRAPAKALLGQAVFFFRKGRRILFVFFLLPSTPPPATSTPPHFFLHSKFINSKIATFSLH